MHAFLHVLGFHHEQVRTDRDDFVVINWANIPQGIQFTCSHQLGKLSTKYTLHSLHTLLKRLAPQLQNKGYFPRPAASITYLSLFLIRM